MAALGRFVLAGKEKLCLIRPMGDALALETLFVGEDVKLAAEIDEAVADAEVKKPELDLAQADHRVARGAVRPRRAAQRVPRDAPGAARGEARRPGDRGRPEPASRAPVVDLMEALRASVAAASKKPAAKKRPRRLSQGDRRGP